MKGVLFSLLFIINFLGNAVELPTDFDHKVDSIKQVLSVAKDDTNYIRVLRKWYFLIPRDHLALQKEVLTKIANRCEKKLNEDLSEKELQFYRHWYGNSLTSIGASEKYLYNYNDAIKYLFKALKHIEQWGSDTELANVYNDIGRLYYDMDQSDMALLYFKKTTQLKSMQNDGRTARALTKIGDILYDQEKYKLCVGYYHQSLSIYKNLEIDWPQSIGMSCCSLGDTYLKLNMVDSAKYYHEKGIKILLTIESFNVKAFALNESASLDFRAHNYSSAILKSKEAVNYASKGLHLGIESRAHEILFESYSKLNNSKEALKHHILFVQLRDSTEAQENVNLAIQNNIKYEYSKKVIIDSLSIIKNTALSDKKHQLEISKQESKTTLAYVVLAIVFVLALFFWNAYRQKNIISSVLEKNNKLINQALKDKEIFMKEIHHRVKNNMQMVSSILEIKSRSSTSQETKGALKESQERIYSMSLSHQKMYEEDNYEAINISAYIKDIIETLFTSGNKVQLNQFHFKGEALLVNVEQAQAIGFIAHELAANSIKHAWKEGAYKTLDVVIEKINNEISFLYKDNGIGLPEDFRLDEAKSMGLKLIRSFTQRQLKGTITCSSDNGTKIVLTFTPR